MHGQTRSAKRVAPTYAPVRMPSRAVEYAYYLSLMFSALAPALGLDIPFVAGGMILIVSAICIRQVRSSAKVVYSPIGFLLACAISFLFIQIAVHGESIMGGTVRVFIIWILQLIIIRSLCLRQGFPLRFSLVMFVIGLIPLPYLTFQSTDVVERARVGIETGGLSHPGSLAEWFGFLTVYFALFGLETKRVVVRTTSWLAATGCLFIVGLTVTRGALFGTAIAVTVGFRGILRRGFVPVLTVIMILGLFFASGLFDRAISHYEKRGMEETGRELIWPAVIERIAAAPLIGVGALNVGTYALHEDRQSPPHNSFLFFALSSGIIPSVFYVVFWIQAVWRSFSHTERFKDVSFRIPFLLYTFVSVMIGDLGFMAAWALLALSVGAGWRAADQPKRVLIRRSGGRQTAQPLRPRPEAARY